MLNIESFITPAPNGRTKFLVFGTKMEMSLKPKCRGNMKKALPDFSGRAVDLVRHDGLEPPTYWV